MNLNQLSNSPMMAAMDALVLRNLQEAERSEARRRAKYQGDIIRETSLNEIPGIGEKTKATLIASGIDSVEKLMSSDLQAVLDKLPSPISKKQVSDFYFSKKEVVKEEGAA